MKAEPRRPERPSLLSRRIIRTNKINGNENMKLQERLEELAGRQRQKDKSHEEEVLSIKTGLNRVRNVKEKMEISPDRRKFLMEHGVKLQVRDVYMEDFITAVDNALEKPEKILFLSNSSDDKVTNSDFSSCSSIPELTRARDTVTPASKSVSFSDDNFPLHLPVHMLRKKTKAKGPSQQPSTAESVLDEDDMSGRESVIGRSSRASSSRPTRPVSGKAQASYQFRVITPPLKGRQIVEVYKELEEEEKLVKKLLEKKKFHDRVKKEEELKKKAESKRRKGVAGGTNGKSNAGTRSQGRPKSQSGESSQKEVESMEGKATSLANERLSDKEIDEMDLNLVASKNNPKQTDNLVDVDLEFEKLMQKSLQLKSERKERSAPERSNDIASGRLKTTNASGLGRTMDYLRPENRNTNDSKITKRHLRLSLPSDIDDGEFTATEKKSSCVGSAFDIEKWDELVRKIRGELNEFKARRPATADRAVSFKTRISRISHPTAVDMDEDIIYDARPDKSVAKGYATMQMTVGKRTVSVCVPRFKNEAICKEQTAGWAHAKSEMNVEQGRERKNTYSGRKTSLN